MKKPEREICRVGGGFVLASGMWMHTHTNKKGDPAMISGPVEVYPEIDMTLLLPIDKCVPISEETWKGCNQDLPSLPLWRKTRWAFVVTEKEDDDIFILFDCEIGERIDPGSKEILELAHKMYRATGHKPPPCK